MYTQSKWCCLKYLNNLKILHEKTFLKTAFILEYIYLANVLRVLRFAHYSSYLACTLRLLDSFTEAKIFM